MGLDLYAEMFPESDYAHFYVKTIHDENFYDTSATLRTWAGALEAIRKHAVDARINSEIPTFFASQFEKALKAGYGEEDVASLIKVLRDS
jgi:3-hydroxyisobutyrate dehydrogenase-like beta-hydroxyacid dehydrogenase